jgi:hypothetical protein
MQDMRLRCVCLVPKPGVIHAPKVLCLVPKPEVSTYACSGIPFQDHMAGKTRKKYPTFQSALNNRQIIALHVPVYASQSYQTHHSNY